MVTIEGPRILSSAALRQRDGSGMLLLFHASEESGAHFRAWSQRWSILLRECSERCSECTYYCSLRLCAIFLHAPRAVETRCYFSLVSHGKTRKAFSAPRQVRGDDHSNGQGNCKIPSARLSFNELNKILEYDSCANWHLYFTTLFTTVKTYKGQ